MKDKNRISKHREPSSKRYQRKKNQREYKRKQARKKYIAKVVITLLFFTACIVAHFIAEGFSF